MGIDFRYSKSVSFDFWEEVIALFSITQDLQKCKSFFILKINESFLLKILRSGNLLRYLNKQTTKRIEIMTTIEINNKKYSATLECADILKANSDCNQTMSFLISLSILSGDLIKL